MGRSGAKKQFCFVFYAIALCYVKAVHFCIGLLSYWLNWRLGPEVWRPSAVAQQAFHLS